MLNEAFAEQESQENKFYKNTEVCKNLMNNDVAREIEDLKLVHLWTFRHNNLKLSYA